MTLRRPVVDAVLAHWIDHQIERDALVDERVDEALLVLRMNVVVVRRVGETFSRFNARR